MRRVLFLIGLVAVFSLFSVLEAYAQTAPDKPENFLALDVSPTKITLQWDEPGDDGGSAVTGYKISFRIHPSQTYTAVATKFVGTSVCWGTAEAETVLLAPIEFIAEIL